MDGYEKILKLMREQGQKLNPEGLRFAQMVSPRECILGSLSLDEDDLLVAFLLEGKLEKGDGVLVQSLSNVRHSIEKYDGNINLKVEDLL